MAAGKAVGLVAGLGAWQAAGKAAGLGAGRSTGKAAGRGALGYYSNYIGINFQAGSNVAGR